jgi:hypothetical protein
MANVEQLVEHLLDAYENAVGSVSLAEAIEITDRLREALDAHAYALRDDEKQVAAREEDGSQEDR